MRKKYILLLILSALSLQASGNGYRDILRLQENGMHSRSRQLFHQYEKQVKSAEPAGWAVLNSVMMRTPGYENEMELYMKEYPYSKLAVQIRYHHALNLFDAQDYMGADEVLDNVEQSKIYRGQVDEYLFKKAYCELERGDLDRALLRFIELERRPISDYTAPAKYSIAYIHYRRGSFEEAYGWFERAALDNRFAQMSNYYIMECRFMLKDYKYVTRNGEEMLSRVPSERKSHLARIISESWLVMGNAEEARKYYDMASRGGDRPKSRTDWFYSGSLMYAVADYKGAIDSFNMMGEKLDSLGQVANYQMGYSYIQTRNKVAALEAFKSAANVYYDQAITEDAYFNWAKLAFDINNDHSVFQDYIKKYSDKQKGDRIYSYMAVAALYERNYAGAVEAYGMIDELDDDMRNNYMKANYLRAHQLISAGSYRLAVPCLKISAYYSDKSGRFNQLARFWLAESYYRNDKYSEAKDLYMELYNQSALNRQEESYLIPYNIAYCLFKNGDYKGAQKWFYTYLDGSVVKYRKDALERVGDCAFVEKAYGKAAASYDLVIRDFFDVNDIYPYYQSALAHGFAGNQDKKMKLLSNVFSASPDSQFYPEALFELGRSYVAKDDDANAFYCFNKLAESAKDTTYIAKAYIEMGSLSRNRSQFNEALEYYKAVVENMPMSGYSEDALAAIESICQTKNEPEEYLKYIESIGKGATKTADEKEQMIFNAAEQNYLSGNYQKALASLQAYLDTYPAGKYAYNAEFYIADSYRNLGKLEQACDGYEKVIVEGTGSFVELSMLHFSDLSYSLERWDDAFGGYSSLYSNARLDNNRLLAMIGMMRSAYRGHKWEDALKNADKVMFDSRVGSELRVEAEYVKAKSYMATSRREEALRLMEKLAADVSGAYGAEAAYILILDSYDKGEFSEMENKVYEFADSQSPHVYWLAKSFVVLGDSFADRGELAQAKATFESVRDGYNPTGADDDVLDNVRMRLEKLQILMSSSN